MIDLRDISEFSCDGYRFKLHLYRSTKDWYKFYHRDIVEGIQVIGQLVRLQSFKVTSMAFFHFPVVNAEKDCIKVIIHNHITESNIQILTTEYFNSCTDIIFSDGSKVDTVFDLDVFGDIDIESTF